MPENPTAREGVLAVLVVPEESTRLERVLGAIGAGERKPSRLVIAVTSSDASQAETVVGAQSAGVPTTVRAVGRQANLATALDAVLADDAGAEPWVWLLHEDSAPVPSCLAALVRTGQSSGKIGVVGPKQISYGEGHLLEVGIRATRRARRVPEIGDEERDQGQYDLRSDVLGVGTAGMLVRRAAGDAVGWLDPALGPFGDGLEFCRRMWMGQWRVVVSPQASIAHERKSLGDDERLSYGARRAAQAYNGVLASPRPLFHLTFLAYVVAGPFRALARLLVKEPRLAAEEMEASGRLASMFAAIHAGRRRIAKARKAPDSVLRSLEDRPADVRRARRDLKRARAEAAQLASDPGPLVQAELRRWRASTRRCAILALLVGTVVGVVAHLPVLGRTLTGGALLPDAWTASDLVGSAGEWLASGDGVAAPVDALWVLLAPFVALARTDLAAIATGIVVLAIPLAALTGFLGARALTASPHVRAAAAIGWAMAPPLLGAVSQGHVAGAIWHILAPLALSSIVTAWRRGSVPALGCAAIVMAYMSAAAPATLVLAVLVSAAGVIRHPGRRWRWLWVAVPALAVLLPTLRAALDLSEPWRVFASTPGKPSASIPSGVGLLSFSPTSSAELTPRGFLDFLAVLVPALLILLSIASLLRRRHSGTIRAGFVLLGVGWIWAGVAAATTVADAVAGATVSQARGWAGIGLSLAFLGVFVILASAGDGLRADLRKRAFGMRHVTLMGAAAAAGVFPLILGGAWSAASLNGGDSPAPRALRAAPAAPIPAVAANDQNSQERSRVLVLDPADAGIRATLLRGPGPQLHETSMVAGLALRGPDAADSDLASTVVSLSGNSESFAENVSRHAVSVVLVPRGRSDASTTARTLMAQLDATAGLEYVTSNASGTFWRVRPRNGTPARLRVVSREGSAPVASGVVSADAEVAQFQGSRRLVLAERADPGWKATLDGRELSRVSAGWRQAWSLPEDGGTVTVAYGGVSARLLALGQAVILFAAVVVALPLRRRKPVRK